MRRNGTAAVFVCLAAAVVVGEAGIVAAGGQDPAKTPVVPPSEYQLRRAALAKAIGPDAVFIAFSAAPARRSGDIDWPFRQEDNLLYLTGVNTPDTTLALLPGESKHAEVIFASEPDPLSERWTGRVPPAGEITDVTGVRDVMPSRRVDEFVDALFQGATLEAPGPATYYAPPFAPAFAEAFRAGRAELWLLLQDRGVRGTATREQRFADELRRRYPELRVRDAAPILKKMREIKSASELSLIQRAIDITVEAQKAAMTRVLTAARESEVQATIEFTFRNLGACCAAFPPIVASGRNATTLHYESNNDSLARGGLLLADIGAEVEGYAADITRTFPVTGTFSPEQRSIHDAVLAVLTETVPLMRPGHRFIEIQEKAQEVVGRELVKLGLMTKNTREQSELYLFHGPGHPLGLQTHDVYDNQRPFEPNMVFTNEPGIYVRKGDVLASEVFKKLSSAEQQSVRAALDRYDGIGVRIEDDVLITSGAPKVLSGGAPRSAREIEAWMSKRPATGPAR